MDYRTIAFYLSLFLIAGTLFEIYARKKEAVKVERNSSGRVISSTRSVAGPAMLLIAAIVTAIATRFFT